jgi:transcriptional regulator with XRE-family HTH domain
VAGWGKAVTTEEAKRCIALREGFVEDEGCWIWENPVHTGYGPFRSFWQAANGRIEDGLLVFHDCQRGDQGCVNPAHMRLLQPKAYKRRDYLAPQRDLDAWSKALRAERNVRQWSQSRMAKELGIHTQTLKNWELGIARPTRKLQRVVAGVLGWEAEPRKFVVTVAVQDVLVAHSSGEAIEKAFATLPEPVKGVRKRELIEVRPVK